MSGTYSDYRLSQRVCEHSGDGNTTISRVYRERARKEKASGYGSRGARQAPLLSAESRREAWGTQVAFLIINQTAETGGRCIYILMAAIEFAKLVLLSSVCELACERIIAGFSVTWEAAPCVLHLFTSALANALQVWEGKSPFSLQGTEL